MSHPLAKLPSVDQITRLAGAEAMIARFGRGPVVEKAREVLARYRRDFDPKDPPPEEREILSAQILGEIADQLAQEDRAGALPVFNLTGTVLHTNLGRAPLPREAIEAVATIAAGPSALEFDLKTGKRGNREESVAQRLCRLTGAEAATVVNNNAAAVLLVLNTLALGREVPISRGELIEIGGAFRMPDIMTRSGCRMVEVGTTNRTRLSDYEAALTNESALLLKVHTSNYEITGFTEAVSEKDLASLARAHDLPSVTDLGSGALIDLSTLGLPAEPTPAMALEDGVDLVTFSGDKLLGGPQAGLIVGSKELVAQLNANPLKRALRADKMTLAALEAVLQLYETPSELVRRLPALRLLTRKQEDLQALGEALVAPMQQAVGGTYRATLEPCDSEIGSGAQPGGRLPSLALVLRPTGTQDAGLNALASRLRALPKPVLGRLHQGALWLDLRCLEDEAGFLEQLDQLTSLKPSC